MSDLDHQLRALADSAPPVTAEEATRRVARRRRLVAGLGAAACAPLALIGVTLLRHGDDSLNVVATEPTTTTAETSDSRSAGSEVITRPLIDVDGCDPIRAHEHEGTVDQAFTHRLAASSTTQLVAFGELSPDRYAVVQRHDDSPSSRDDGSRVTEDRVGEGWRHPGDGSVVYVRSRGLADVELALLMEHLVARPSTDPIPGVDVAVNSLGAVIVDETVGPLVGAGATSTCERDGALAHASAFSGTAVASYTFALDRPMPFDIRQQSDGSLLVAWSRSSLPPPPLDSVVQADENTWEELTGRPEPRLGP